MSSADEIALVNTVSRANLGTLAASNAKLVIYRSEIINDLYSIRGTVLFTLATGNTSVKTHLAYLCALLVIGAQYYDTGGVLYHFYYTVRTGARAQAAADTFYRVDLGNTALVNAYRIGGTHAHTVAISKAGKRAVSVTGEAHICRAAGGRTVVIILSALFRAVTVAGNVSNHFNNVLRLNAKHRCNITRSSVTTGYTKIGLVGLTVTECLGV